MTILSHLTGYWIFVFRQMNLMLSVAPLAVAFSVTFNVALITFTSWYVYFFIGWYLIAWMFYVFNEYVRNACHLHLELLQATKENDHG